MASSNELIEKVKELRRTTVIEIEKTLNRNKKGNNIDVYPWTLFHRDSVILSTAKKRVRRPKGLKAISQSALKKLAAEKAGDALIAEAKEQGEKLIAEAEKKGEELIEKAKD